MSERSWYNVEESTNNIVNTLEKFLNQNMERQNWKFEIFHKMVPKRT